MKSIYRTTPALGRIGKASSWRTAALRCLLAASLMVAGGVVPAANPEPTSAIAVGVNKVDLLGQYLGTASGGDGSVAYRRVTTAMARKALDDAADIGVGLMRVSMIGLATAEADGPDNIDRWLADPGAFWARADLMMDDLDARGIRLVPVLMFSSKRFSVITGETTTELVRDPKSKSWQLLSRFVTEFVTRYGTRKTVLFYELTNEMNNRADLDQERRCNPAKKILCEATGNFTSAEMVAFTRRLTDLIRSIDRTRLVSSGFSIPRPSAEHLRARPEWVTGRPDWTLDTREQFRKNLADMHAGVDIVSIHLYGGEGSKRFGSNDSVDLLVEAKRAADAAGKPLFVGEFGDQDARKSGTDSHTSRMLDKIVELRVAYSAVWAWQFYQMSTHRVYETRANGFSLEPGYTDTLIARIKAATGRAKAATAGPDAQPPRVVLTWPLECSLAKPGQAVHAVASDDSGAVARVEFWLDGRQLAADSSPPYETVLPDAEAGARTLEARAFDARGNRPDYKAKVLLKSNAKMRNACLAEIGS